MEIKSSYKQMLLLLLLLLLLSARLTPSLSSAVLCATRTYRFSFVFTVYACPFPREPTGGDTTTSAVKQGCLVHSLVILVMFLVTLIVNANTSGMEMAYVNEN